MHHFPLYTLLLSKVYMLHLYTLVNKVIKNLKFFKMKVYKSLPNSFTILKVLKKKSIKLFKSPSI